MLQPAFFTSPAMLGVEASEARRPLALAVRGHKESPPLLIPTDAGTVLKVISVPKGGWPNAEGLLLEELHMFEVRPSPHCLKDPHPMEP